MHISPGRGRHDRPRLRPVPRALDIGRAYIRQAMSSRTPYLSVAVAAARMLHKRVVGAAPRRRTSDAEFFRLPVLALVCPLHVMT